ncbi:MAG: DUF2782 domain-containing protein [Sulfuricaulis sp.]
MTPISSIHRGICLVLLVLLTPLAWAESSSATSPVPAATGPATPPPEHYNPPAAPGASSTEQLEPQVTITTQGTEIHKEYRLNGRLYMIKVTPVHGKPYYLIDDQGSGQFHRSDIQPHIAVPMWVIKRF